MATLAHKEMSAILARFKATIAEAGYSLRGLAQASDRLEPPERVHHSNLSEILRGREGRDLYLQTFLALCGLIGADPIAVLRDEETALLSEALRKLSKDGRMALIRKALRLLEEEGASEALRTRLRKYR